MSSDGTSAGVVTPRQGHACRLLQRRFRGVRSGVDTCRSTEANINCLNATIGRIFGYPVHLTWEFTSSHPIRSVYPLWPVYGLPMLLLRWVWRGGQDHGHVPPAVVFWALRALMFVLSFVLEDWALHELVQSPRQRRLALLLVASSYVTWTYQTHTFSNSVETLVVVWCLVLLQRLVDGRQVCHHCLLKEFPKKKKKMSRFSGPIVPASIFRHQLQHPRLSGGLWYLQSDHFPRLPAHSEFTACALLLDSVRRC